MTVVVHQARPPDAPPAATPAVPRPAAGTEFFGEYQGSGYAEPRYLVRRADGQVVQLTLLLDLVLRRIDGARDLSAIAADVTRAFGRQVEADDVGYLVDHKLRPAGLVAGEDGADTALPRADLLLAMRGRFTLLGPRQVRAVARVLAWLHLPFIVGCVLAGAVLFDVWLFGVHGAAGPLAAAIKQPQLILAVLGLGIASMLFHELGHASACWYSGARPGRIGCGLYLIWPSLYTDVTDVYRVGRAGRLRTDLGGVYFNTVFMLALAGCYAGTHRPVFLAAILFVHFEIVDQLLPILRFDGYFILADLAGVPDLFGRIRPVLRGLLPGGRAAGKPSDLRRGARIAVTAWVAVTVPLLAAELAWLGWHLPTLGRTVVTSVTGYGHAVRLDEAARHWSALSLDAIAVILLVLPALGLTWLTARVLSRLLRVGAKRIRPRLEWQPPGRHRR